MGGVKWAVSENTVVLTRGSQTCWRTFGRQRTPRRKTRRCGQRRVVDAHLFYFYFFPSECERVPKRKRVFISNKVSGTQVCLSKRKTSPGHGVISACVERTAAGFLTFVFWLRVYVPVLMFVCIFVQISEEREVLCWLWRSMLDLSGRRKRPIFYCNNTGTLRVCACVGNVLETWQPRLSCDGVDIQMRSPWCFDSFSCIFCWNPFRSALDHGASFLHYVAVKDKSSHVLKSELKSGVFLSVLRCRIH